MNIQKLWYSKKVQIAIAITAGTGAFLGSIIGAAIFIYFAK